MMNTFVETLMIIGAIGVIILAVYILSKIVRVIFKLIRIAIIAGIVLIAVSVLDVSLSGRAAEQSKTTQEEVIEEVQEEITEDSFKSVKDYFLK